MKIAALVVFLVAACEIQPAPKAKQQTAQQAAPAAVSAPEAPKLPAEAGGAFGSAKPRLEVTQACVNIGSHVAEVFIASATDPGQKSVYEQERTKMVRATAEACTTQAWPPEALACYNASKNPAEIKACEQKFPPPPPATARPNVDRPAIPGGALPAGVQPAEMQPLDQAAGQRAGIRALPAAGSGSAGPPKNRP